MSVIPSGSGTVTYKAVRKAMGGESYTMSVTDTDQAGENKQPPARHN